MKKAKPKAFQLIRGMKDVLPQDNRRWEYLQNTIEQIARSFGYDYIETPILEDTNLFVRSVGEGSDIVEKEMFSFVDKGGDSVTMRPEGTAPVVRAYIEHGLIRETHPLRLWYRGPMFRYDRPQTGRYRQFNQFGIEVIGEADPLIDVEVLLLTSQLFQKLGLTVSIQINSNGHSECRAKFVKVFQEYAKSKKSMLCEDCRRRLPKNPLRILDCKNESCQTVASAGPQIVDHLCEDCRTHFTRVLEYCDDLRIPYVLNPRIVRGLDYYTKTTFEVWTEGESESAQMALGGGGRYDGLIQELGGRNTPAIGAAFGLERILGRLTDEKRIPERRPDIFVAQLGEKAKRRSLSLIQQLTSEGLSAFSALTKNNLKDQLSIANKRRVRFVLVMGQKEIMDETIMIRDMDSGVQELIDYRKVVDEMKRRIHGANIKIQEIVPPAATPEEA